MDEKYMDQGSLKRSRFHHEDDFIKANIKYWSRRLRNLEREPKYIEANQPAIYITSSTPIDLSINEVTMTNRARILLNENGISTILQLITSTGV